MNESFSTGMVSENVDRRMAEVVAQITDRLQAGEAVDVAAYLARYPELADRLRPLVASLALLDQCRSSAGSGRPTGQDRRRRGVWDSGRFPVDPASRQGRHGRGLRGGAGIAGPARGAQSASLRGHDGCAALAALSERGAGGGVPASHQHRAGVLRRLRAGRAFLRHAVHRRPAPLCSLSRLCRPSVPRS
jgi:hypothetical protein